MLAVLVMAAMELGSFKMPASVDPELAEEVERLVLEQGGGPLDIDGIDDVAWEMGLQYEPEVTPRVKWLLPVLSLYVSWTQAGRERRNRWKFMVFVTWPVG